MMELKEQVSHSGLDKLTITIGSYDMQLYDEADYARRISTIMESGDIKEELGESVLWFHEIKRGCFRLKTKEMWLITNYRVMRYDVQKAIYNAIQLPLKYVDVVVMNARSDHYSEGVGVFLGVPASIASGMGFLRRRGTSTRVGDLVFIMNGQILLVFDNVLDPTGVKQMIYEVKRQMYGNTRSKVM